MNYEIKKVSRFPIASIGDPLYELSTLRLSAPLKRRHLLTAFDTESEAREREKEGEEKRYNDLMSTFEMRRLNFIKEMGLCFLLFPSATHSCLSHSIGTWTIGGYALGQIRVRKAQGEVSLERWMETERGRKLLNRDDFLLSLLLHDVGRTPFSSALENCIGKDGKPIFQDYAHITLDYFRKGRYHKKLQDYIEESPLTSKDEVKTLSTVLNEEDLRTIYEALTGNKELYPVNQLVNGVIELDKMDSCSRDSYFTGLALANTNIKGILESVIIDATEEPKILLEEFGIPHVIQMLSRRETLMDRVIDNDYIRGLEAMLSRGVEIAIDQGLLDKDKVIFYTDDELLHALLKCEDGGGVIKNLVKSVLARRPYPYSYIWRVPAEAKSEDVYNLLAELRDGGDLTEPKILSFVPKGFGKIEGDEEVWLIDLLVMEREEPLSKIKERIMGDLKEQEVRRMSTIRFYFKDEKIGRELKKDLNKVV